MTSTRTLPSSDRTHLHLAPALPVIVARRPKSPPPPPLRSSRSVEFDDDVWDTITRAGFARLERVARARTTISYSELCLRIADQTGHRVEADGPLLAPMLERIARLSFDRLGVVLTVLVRRKGGGYDPGGGFYLVCRELGLLDRIDDERHREAFLIDHQRRIESLYGRSARRVRADTAA